MKSLLLVPALFTLSSAPAWAASPAVSRGEVLLTISFEACMTRARATFKDEGYSIVPAETDNTSFVLARKDIHTAYITCSPAPNEDVWANVFVASSAVEKKVAGAERQKLQNRMAASDVRKWGNTAKQPGLQP